MIDLSKIKTEDLIVELEKRNTHIALDSVDKLQNIYRDLQKIGVKVCIEYDEYMYFNGSARYDSKNKRVLIGTVED